MVVDRFFSWVADATVEQKLRAVEALVAAYGDRRVGDDEREAIEAAMMLVADDPDLAVRRRLAEVLAEADDAPRHLLLTLLDDHPSVAVAIAGRSAALIDAELVDVVAHGADEVRTAVAGRRRVGPTVATALAEAGDRVACVTLLDNAGADIPALALERIVERFGEFAEIRRALLARPHVPITVRHRVLEKLAEAMENLVVVKSWMGRERAEATTRESREKATIALAAAASGAETVVLVEHLRRTGLLTTRLMLRAACIGDLRFVEEALARLADVPSSRVAALVADGRETALRALYRRAAMPDRAWPAFHAAIEVHRELLAETGGLDGRPGDRARFSRRLVERVLTRFTAFERRDADDLLVLLRRYAADAAREHVRNVMATRIADAGRALAAPAGGVAEALAAVTTAAAAPATAMSPGIDATVLGALAAELGVAVDVEPAAAVTVARDGDPAAVPPFSFALPEAMREVDGDLDGDHHGDHDGEYGGLFANVRLEDLPPEWLTDDEIAPDSIFGDDEVPVRLGLTSEPRFDTALRSEPEARFDPDLRHVDDLPAAADLPDHARAAAALERWAIEDGERAEAIDPANAIGDEYDIAIGADDRAVLFADAPAMPVEACEPAPRETAQSFVDGLRHALDAVLTPSRRAA